MNVLVVDDDYHFSRKFRDDFIEYFKSINKVITFDILNSDYKNFNFEYYDIAFLDIDLKTANGIEIGAKLRKLYPKIILIYVSIRDELVFQTLSTGVYQFIRKSHYEVDRTIVFKQLKQTLLAEKIRFLEVNKRKEVVQISKIKYIVALGKEVIITENKQLALRSSIKDILKTLDYPYLVQINRNTAVNCDYITKIQKNIVYTKDEKQYPVGKKYLQHLYDVYEEFILK